VAKKLSITAEIQRALLPAREYVGAGFVDSRGGLDLEEC
jgi:hypothetical protein